MRGGGCDGNRCLSQRVGGGRGCYGDDLSHNLCGKNRWSVIGIRGTRTMHNREVAAPEFNDQKQRPSPLAESSLSFGYNPPR